MPWETTKLNIDIILEDREGFSKCSTKVINRSRKYLLIEKKINSDGQKHNTQRQKYVGIIFRKYMIAK